MRFFSIPVVILALVSCSESSPTFDTGVPNDTEVDELTTEQAQQVCERAEDLSERVIGPEVQHRLQCVGTAIAYDLANLGSCKSSYDDCIDEPFDADPIDFACETVEAPDVAGCNATIGEIEACANAQLKLVDDLLDQANCDLVDDPDRLQEIIEGLEERADPEACASLPDSCPDFFGGAMEGMAGP